MRTHVHVGEEAKRGITRGQEKVLGEVEGREDNDVVRQKRDQLCRTRGEGQSEGEGMRAYTNDVCEGTPRNAITLHADMNVHLNNF